MKAGARAELLSKRAALSGEERRRQSRAIADRLRELPAVREATLLGGYYALPTEVDPGEFLQEAARRRRVALPRVEGSFLRFHSWTPGDPMSVGPLGVAEPGDTAPPIAATLLDLVLVPGVGFDRDGHRLGRGGGHYDRLLASAPQAVRVGLAFDVQVVHALPREPHDERLDWLVSARAVLHFQREG